MIDVQLLRGADLISEVEEIVSVASRPYDVIMPEILSLACRHLGLELGIVARIRDDKYRVAFVYGPEEMEMYAGQVFDLTITFCSITVATRQVTAFEDVTSTEWDEHPAYRAFRLRAYIGAPVIVNGQVTGTVNFSSRQPLEKDAFTPDIHQAVAHLAKWIGRVTAQGYL